MATRGSLQEIRVQDPGFDYVDIPKVSISGGNGTGAVAECKMVTVPHQVVFNAGGGSQTIVVTGSDDFNVGFLTYHKFRNYERLVYDTFSEKALAGFSTGAIYYINTNAPTGMTTISTWVGYAGTTWYPEKTIRLHRNLSLIHI